MYPHRQIGFLALAVVVILVAPFHQARAAQNEVTTYHVQGNVYLLLGAGSNIAVQVGDDGVLVVDAGRAEMGDQVLEAIRQLSTGPIRWMVNTHAHLDHTGGNEAISQAGMTVNGNPAAIVSHENVPLRMVEMSRPAVERPVNTFFEDRRDFYFNGEAVFLYHFRGHTDGDTIVYFRGSDVLVSGDLFTTTAYPVIDLDLGGSVEGFIEGLNTMLDITVPAWLQDGGTYVIPGHGRVSDEADVVEYRDMLLIISERVQHMINEGMSLEEIQAAEPALDYDTRYGTDRGPWTTAMFIEAIYRDLSR